MSLRKRLSAILSQNSDNLYSACKAGHAPEHSPNPKYHYKSDTHGSPVIPKICCFKKVVEYEHGRF